jgi:tryptophanyl-tRNA synthetase
LTDSPDAIIKKFKRAVTDSDNTIKYCDSKPGIKNLISIYSSLTEKSIESIESEFEGKGYGAFKQAVAELVIESLKPIREKYQNIKADMGYIEDIYRTGSQKANSIANKTLTLVRDRLGLINN